MAEDYYQLLQVPRSASSDEIQKAYRKLARKYHPDLHADKSEREKERAKQRFQEIQHAYDVLNDTEKREMYDRFGPEFENAGGGFNPNAGANPFGGMDIDISQLFGGGAGGPRSGGKQSGGFEDIFRHFGGGARTPNQAQPGRDVEQEITVSFHTAVMGGEHQISLQRRSGSTEMISVKIPAGIEDGKKIRLRGQGEMGARGAKRGDLLIRVKVAPHPVYTRAKENLSVQVPITLKEAIFGAKIDLPTPHGTVTVTVPERCQNGKTLRLKGLGVKSSSKQGDLLVKLLIHIPEEITKEDIELLDRLSEHWNQDSVRSELNW